MRKPEEIQAEFQKLAGIVGDRSYRVDVHTAEMNQAKEQMLGLEKEFIEATKPKAAPAEVEPLIAPLELQFPDKAP